MYEIQAAFRAQEPLLVQVVSSSEIKHNTLRREAEEISPEWESLPSKSSKMEDGGARSPLPGQRGECRRGGIFRSIDQFWDTNTSDLLYGLQNIVCVLQVDALQSQKNRDTHYRTPKSALFPGYQVSKFASLQAPPWLSSP